MTIVSSLVGAPVGPNDAFQGRQQTLRHFLGLGILLFLAVPRWSLSRSAPATKTLLTVYSLAIAPSIDLVVLAKPDSLFFRLVAAAALVARVLAVMPVSFAFSVLAAGAVSFSVMTLLVFAAASAFLMLSVFAAALCRAGSVMIWHFVFLRSLSTYVIISSISRFRHMSITNRVKSNCA